MSKMKHMDFLSILLGFLLIVSSCSEKSVPVNKDKVSKQPSIVDDIPSDVTTDVFDKATTTTKNAPEIRDVEEDCHGKRKVSQTLEKVEGSILKIADKYVISTNNGNSRYNPCKLSKMHKKDGVLIHFSGDVLEIFPGERLIATPFRIKNIAIRDE